MAKPKKRSLHISTVRRSRSYQAIYGKYRRPHDWEMHCNCGIHYMTDAGWKDAMAYALAHRVRWPDTSAVMVIELENVGWTNLAASS